LAAVLEESGQMTLATTVSLLVVRGPAVLAKTLTALDVLSGGRLIVVAGPGSSRLDYAAARVPLEERWARFDEAVPALRALLRGQPGPPDGRFYALADVRMAPARPDGAPVWVASWGSPAGLRRVRRDGDGWLASAYNISAAHFASCMQVLGDLPNAIGTAWMYVTEDPRQAEAMIGDVLAPMLDRDPGELRAAALPIGPAELCVRPRRCSAHLSLAVGRPRRPARALHGGRGSAGVGPINGGSGREQPGIAQVEEFRLSNAELVHLVHLRLERLGRFLLLTLAGVGL
jgi:hypothetical protein